MSELLAVDVLVVGGGISGLAAALTLKKEGKTILLAEGRGYLGGAIRTVADSGYLLEMGPNSIMLSPEDALFSWINEVGLEKDMIKASPQSQNRYVWLDGKLIAAPLTPLSFLTTPLFTFQDKVRILKEYLIPPGSGLPQGVDETVAHFVRRRLGDAFLEKLIDPFVKGVYASHPDLLSVSSGFPLLTKLELEHGGLIRGAIKLSRSRRRTGDSLTGPSGGLYSFTGGLSVMVRSFSRALGDESLFHGELISWKYRPSGEIESTLLQDEQEITVVSQKMILAVSPQDASRVFKETAPELSSTLESIPMAPIAIAYVGVDQKSLPDYQPGFGVLFPSKEKRKILGIIQSSDLFPGRAPSGKILLTVFVGGMINPKLAMSFDEDFQEIVLGELKAVMGLNSAPEFFRIQRWSEGISQYTPGHAGRIEMIRRLLPEGIFLAGNYLSGISVAKTFNNGIDAAKSLLRTF